jgi:hypothetical protein
MTLPSEYTFREPEKLVNDLTEMYRLLRESIEGYTEEFEGVIFGSSADGVGTYTSNDCYYVRRGTVIDLFYNIVWSAHTGTGDLRIKLPFFEKGFASPVSISPIVVDNMTWPSGNHYLVVEGQPDQDYAIIKSCKTAAASQTVQMDGSAGISFHHRYIGQVEK